jgi:hypothetical protein
LRGRGVSAGSSIRDRYAVRVVIGVMNVLSRLFGRHLPFRVHPDREVDARIRAAGFEPIVHERGIAWQTVLYPRSDTAGV